MSVCDTVNCCMVFIMCRDSSSFTGYQLCSNQIMLIQNHMYQEHSESAQEQRIVLYKGDLWNLRAVICFPFPVSSLVPLPSPVALSFHFSANDCFFLQRILQYLCLTDMLFCTALVLGDDSRWYVQLAVI